MAQREVQNPLVEVQPESPGTAVVDTGKPQKKSNKTCIIVTVVVLLVCIGVGVGVGVGVSQSSKDDDNSSSSPAAPPPPGPAATDSSKVVNLTQVKNKLLAYVPVDMQGAPTDELVGYYTAQVARIAPVSTVLATLLPTFGIANQSFIQPQAIQMYVEQWMQSNKVDDSSLAATLDTLAQMAQGVTDYQAKLLDIVQGLGGTSALVRAEVDRALAALNNATGSTGSTGSSGRRMLGATGVEGAEGEEGGGEQVEVEVEPLHRRILQTDVQAAILSGARTALASEAARPYVDALRRLGYDPEGLPQLLSSLYTIATRLVSASAQLKELVERLDTHFGTDLFPSLPVFNPLLGVNTSLVIDVVPFDKPTRTASALGGSPPGGSTARRRRRLQQSSDPLRTALERKSLPRNFTAAAASPSNRVLVPLVFHVLTYSSGSGYGPSGWDRAADYVSRLVWVANNMAFRSGFQFFINEIRSDPTRYPYLLKPDRSSWMACSTKGNYFYLACAEVLQGASDHPRSINIFVSGDRADASYAGYGWVPSSATDITRGHVALTWSVLDTAQWNSQASGAMEYGGKVLWHELMHHLGSYHTFGKSNAGSACTDSGAGSDDVADTPVIAGASYNQVWSRSAYDYCLRVFRNTRGSDWNNVVQYWRNQLGIPPEDQAPAHSFDSCPSQPGMDELGNYISYTHDVCIPALGHITAGQAEALHRTASTSQKALYNWGQYFARVAPDTFAAPPPPPSPPPPPVSSPPPPSPPPPPPPLSRCLQTRGGCRCRTSWTYAGKTLTGCGNPDGDAVGLWCPIEQDGNCPSAVNGYWDYCPPDTSLERCQQEFPVPPSPPPARPPPPTVKCGAGWYTLSGATCSREPWAFVRAGVDGQEEESRGFLGCANPDNDPQGSWCRLQAGYATIEGRNWDYCGPSCEQAGLNNTGSPLPAPPPPAPPGTGVQQAGTNDCPASQGLPAGCSCRPTWGAVMRLNATAGRRYVGARACTYMPELAGQVPTGAGVCEVVGCSQEQPAGRVMVCSTACTTLSRSDGTDVDL
ncbi:hypothetical protein HYH03_005337 [Edaphochlamys debaryana]|uniref:Peptidase M43 pregnancy-associated plasma-A domain-containing protein n=1 Tax=Edaphochlamys debaryana TaxID=47281 RepID=A0A836C2B7_9CHLO|nr:hypothetical protein HYH03_005337 [Edaphochlamys debaryana]|eukprot:KAG2496513.1 hypothetical protein HYH03_005337 [Edaphochlamys debaryana]